jgi:cell division protein FtsQ
MSIGRVRKHYGMNFPWRMLLKIIAFTTLLMLTTLSYNKLKNAEYVEVDKIKERLMQLPWISQVIVRRVWPNLVVVSIGEKTPVALWNGASLLSTTGELFSPPVDSIPAHLPQLVGPSGEQLFMAQYYAKINDVLMPLHFKIARLELTPSMTWNLMLDNGIKLSVGHKDVLTRLNHFVKVYSKIVGNRVAEVDYIDLRYPNGMAVRWKSVT